MIEVTYQDPRGGNPNTWSTTNMFHRFYSYLNENYDCCHKAATSVGYSTPNSPHIMSIKNIENNKYFVVSYWDHTKDVYNPAYEWDVDNMVELFTSSGMQSYSHLKFTPLSYMTYSTDYEQYSENRVPYDKKPNNELTFRGYFYGLRQSLKELKEIPMYDNRISPFEYFTELTNNKICLSLNGVAEICNRDIEIMAAGSVLLRPLLKQKFHNELIPNVHYIAFENSDDPVEQMRIIKDKYNEIKNDDNLLRKISSNGYEWYLKNGTVQANVDILKSILNMKLIM